MVQIIKVHLGGEERRLQFNNFAHVEISKVLFKSGEMAVSPNDVLVRLQELANLNTMLLFKILVYAGMVGNDYVNGFEPSASQEQVGEWIAQSNDSDLIGIWDSFLDAMGLNLPIEGTPSEDIKQEKKS